MATLSVHTVRSRSVPQADVKSPLLPPGSSSSTTRVKPRRLLNLEELPEWQRSEGGYVLTGYREETPSFWQCVQTWSFLHNESGTSSESARMGRSTEVWSVNIYSHLIGAFLFFGLLSAVTSGAKTYFRHADAGEITVLCIYALGVAICYVLSVLFHTLLSHSRAGCAFGIQLDFQGIIILIWSATSPLIFYTFHSEPALQTIYTTAVRV